MAETYYAWSNFPMRNADGTGKTIKAGEKISQNDLGVDDDEWNYLVEVGAVRTTPYPDVSMGQSPTEYLKDQIAKAEGSADAYNEEVNKTKPTEAGKSE